MCLRRTVGQYILSQNLPGERCYVSWQRLGFGGNLSRNVRLWYGMLFDGEQRRAIGPIEDEEETLFTRLGDSVYVPAIVLHRQQNRMSGEVTVPKVMMHTLKMPEQLSCACIERQKTVCIEVISNAISSVEIECSRPGRNVNNSARLIQCHSRPIIRSPHLFVRVVVPGLVTRLARMRDC